MDFIAATNAALRDVLGKGYGGAAEAMECHLREAYSEGVDAGISRARATAGA